MAVRKYDHKKIEKKWQKKWATGKIYKTTEGEREKCYVLDMFPYPSGEGLHVGHPKGYIATDIYSRFKRMSGFEVLHPMGWDAFGLPAENYAIKNKTHPRLAVEKNIKRYKEQLSIIGFDYDWSREINTTDPAYYKWTQWIFLKLYERGLAYESHEPINWCPSCQTGLANEDLEAGKCERCGSVVEKRPMRQWVLKITDYAERLLADLPPLNWPEHIKESQRNWIGKSEGAEIDFMVKSAAGDNAAGNSAASAGEKITVFTSRPETIFGATYLVLAPEHNFVAQILPSLSAENREEVEKYLATAQNKTEIDRTTENKDKTGVKLEGLVAINPANDEEIPIFVADYVLSSYGTGAIMAVPAHDERDFSFAKKYGLPIKQVVAPHLIDQNNPPVDGKENTKRVIVHAIVKHPTEEKFIALKNKKFPWKTPITGGVEDGEEIETAICREILEETGYKNLKLLDRMPYVIRADFYAAHKNVNRQVVSNIFLFKLENLDKNEIDTSEQEKHDVIWEDWSKIDTLSPVVELGHIVNWLKKGDHPYTGDGVLINSTDPFNESATSEARSKIIEFLAKKTTAILTTKYKIRDWVFSRQRYWGEPIPMIHCEKCGAVPVPEKDLPVKLPEVKNYEPTGTGESPLAAIEKWVNVKCPKCGGKAKRETNTMPQWAGSSWYYLRFMDPKNSKALVDPAKEKYWNQVDVYVGGDHAVRHLIYARFWHKFLYDIGTVSTSEPFKRLEFLGFILAEDGRKMSKRYGNVINPDDIVHTYGADTLRVYEMFMSPFSQTTSWDTKAIMGSERFVERVWRIGERFAGLLGKTNSAELLISLHKTIKKVSEDIETFGFNTAISSLMILSRELEHATDFTAETLAIFLKLCAPFMPHVTEEIWATQKLAKNSIHKSPWPTFDAKLTEKNTVKIAIQVNGKVRDEVKVAPDTDEKTLTALALERPEVKRWLEGREVKKTVFVKGRILSFVV